MSGAVPATAYGGIVLVGHADLGEDGWDVAATAVTL